MCINKLRTDFKQFRLGKNEIVLTSSSIGKKKKNQESITNQTSDHFKSYIKQKTQYVSYIQDMWTQTFMLLNHTKLLDYGYDIIMAKSLLMCFK